MITKQKGTYDILGSDAKVYNYINELAHKYMDNYNYEYIRTPIIEASELYHRSAGESSDIVTKETYDFTDRGGRNITLRPEGTAGVVRSVIENKLYGNRTDAMKYFYFGPMYRYERPQSGRNREFTQFGVEVFNSDDVLIDAEVISLGYNFLQELGIEDVCVHINTLGDQKTRSEYTKALVSYLTPHINDLCDDCKERLKKNPLRILDCKVDKDSPVLMSAPRITDYLSDSSKERFEKLKEYLNILEVNYEVNPNIVRGLDYYDHDVFEYITDAGVTVGAGGRYNNLVKSLGGPDIPAVGFGLGVERLILEIKDNFNENALKNNVDVYIMCINEEEKMHAINIANILRLNDVRVEVNNNNLSLKSQFKIADNLMARELIILNSEDLQKGLINIKDNATKDEVKIDEKDVVDYILSNI